MSSFGRAAVVLLAAVLAASSAHGVESSLTEEEAPLLSEDRLAGVINKEHCIILYYNSALDLKDEAAKSEFGATRQELADQLMRSMIALADRVQAPIRFYRVNWKDFRPKTMERIRSDAGTLQQQPESPAIVTYVLNGPIAHRFSGTARPDMLPWFVHEVMDYFIHAIKTPKGEYLRGGWTYTDTNASFTILTDVQKETREFNGMAETVQVVSHVSRRYEGFACAYEHIYTSDGRLLGSIEDYGKYGKFGYFDFDRAGKLQYRVRYSASPK